MPSYKLSLDYNKSLEVANGELRVRKSLKAGTSLDNTKTNGLYANAPKGDPGPSGDGYPDGYQSANVIISGYKKWEDVNASISSPTYMAAHSCVHRIYDATDADGHGIPLRTNDTLYPGDMIRYRDNVSGGWLYKIIIRTTGREINELSRIVAAIPDSYTEVN